MRVSIFTKGSKKARMKNREKLKKLVQIIGDLLKVEGNEWLIDEILKTIGKTSPVEQIAKHSLIQNIHEYCVEQKINKQATEFYKSFPIQEIKNQLILDYKKMEHERRRDDFENFCLCLYQQIENITNYLFESRVVETWNKVKHNIAIKSFYDRNQKKYVFPTNGGTSIEKLVFQNTNPIDDLSKWHANRKFRALLYFFYFAKEVTRDDYGFNSIYFIHEEIYQMRNQNHRGSKPSEYQQKTLNKIKGNESKYYFKFYGFLQDFLTQIEYNVSNQTFLTEKKIENKIGINRKFANTLGDSPELAELFEQLKEKD